MRTTLENYLIFCDNPKSETKYLNYSSLTKEDTLLYDFKEFVIKVRDKYLEERRYQVIISEEDNTYKFVLDNLNIDIKAIIEALMEFKDNFIETIKSMKRYNKETQIRFVREELSKMKRTEYTEKDSIKNN